MLRTLKELASYTIGASDGDMGHVKDVYFDDEDWVIRYLVVETGSWLSSRKVLISPYSIGNADWVAHRLPARISKEQVRNSPDIDTEQPVSRQHEIQYADYYSYPYYWEGSGYWGDGMYAPTMGTLTSVGDVSRDAVQREVADVYARAEHTRHERDDPHLRSGQAVVGYHVQASDGEIGHVSGMLVDEESWAIRYLVVDTSNWWMGHQVLVTSQWITAVDWYESKVHVNLTRESIQGAPAFDSSYALNRQHELDLYRHHQRPNYWEHESQRELALE